MLSKRTISTLPALPACRIRPETVSQETPFSGYFRQFLGKAEIQGALAYTPDQFFPESQEYRVLAISREMTEKGQNPSKPDSGISLNTVWSGSGEARESRVFRVPPGCQKRWKYSPFCLVRDHGKAGNPGPGSRIRRVDLGSWDPGSEGCPSQNGPGCYPTLTPDPPGSGLRTGPR